MCATRVLLLLSYDDRCPFKLFPAVEDYIGFPFIPTADRSVRPRLDITQHHPAVLHGRHLTNNRCTRHKCTAYVISDYAAIKQLVKMHSTDCTFALTINNKNAPSRPTTQPDVRFISTIPIRFETFNIKSRSWLLNAMQNLLRCGPHVYL